MPFSKFELDFKIITSSKIYRAYHLHGAGIMTLVDEKLLIFRINHIVRAIETTSGLSDLDITARSILSFIGEAEAVNRTLNVSDVVNGPGFGTAPTVYSRLAELEKAGWIKSTPDPRDGRAKQVRLTAMARRTYAKMSKEALKILTPNKA